MSDENDTTGPRERDVGQGYPEEQPADTGIDADEHPEDDVTPDHDAPQTEKPRDGGASQATGNPNAAGG